LETNVGIRFYDPEETLNGLPAAIFLEAATAHEVGHMWFYDQVMTDQVDEPWLDESLVQYVTYLYYLDRYGKSGGDGFRESLLSRWDRVNREPVSIALPAMEYQGLEYGAIIYGRGALFFEELEGLIGKVELRELLNEYVDAFRWKVARTDDFLNMAEEKCACDLTEFYAEWGFER